MSYTSIFAGGRSARIKVTLDNQGSPAIDTTMAIGGSAPFTGGIHDHSYILSVDSFGNIKVVLSTDNPEGPIVRIECYPGETFSQAQFAYLSIGTSGSVTVLNGQTYSDGVVIDSSHIYSNFAGNPWTTLSPAPTSSFGGQVQYFVSKTTGWLALALGPVVQLPPVIVAPNETLTTAINTPVSVTPVITADGVATAPDSLAVTQPTHGVATVAGATITYTPATLYYGADSFTYTATIAGVTSSAATVSVTVPPPPPPRKRLQFDVQIDEDVV